jgi:hypothetical protein
MPAVITVPGNNGFPFSVFVPVSGIDYAGYIDLAEEMNARSFQIIRLPAAATLIFIF